MLIFSNYLKHSNKGTKLENNKYIKKEGARYVDTNAYKQVKSYMKNIYNFSKEEVKTFMDNGKNFISGFFKKKGTKNIIK